MSGSRSGPARPRTTAAVESATGETERIASVGDAADLFMAAGARTEVRMTSRALSAVYDWLAGWFGVQRPPALARYERMLSAAA